MEGTERECQKEEETPRHKVEIKPCTDQSKPAVALGQNGVLQLFQYSFGMNKMVLVVRKPVFGVSDQVRRKPCCTATRDCKRLEISDLGRRRIVLSV